MAGGLLDFFGGDTSDPGAMDPRMMGLLGMAGAMGSAFAPQPASRLPLAQPNMANMLGLAAGGYGQGYGQGLRQQMIPAQIDAIKAQTYGQGLQNMNATQSYNMWAPFLGSQPLPMPGMAPQNAPQGGSGTVTPSMGAPSPFSGAPSGPVMPPGGLSAAPVPGAPGQASGAPSMASLYQLPPPLLQKMGITVPPELTAAYAAGMTPGSAEWNTLARNSAMKLSGVQPAIGGERPGVPSSYYNPATGKYEADTSQLPALEEAAAATARGTSMGGLPAKQAEAAFNAGLKVNTDNEIERRRAFYQTGVMPPDYSAKPVEGPGGAIASPRGTVVPPAPKTPFMGNDALLKQNENTKTTEENFGKLIPTLDGAESRLTLLADAMKQVEGKGFNEQRAALSNRLRGLGMTSAANSVMTEKDTAAVQKAIGVQVIDVLNQLKTTIGPGQRLLNSEFVNTLDKQYGPDMTPEANHDLLKEALGGIYQTRNMIDDYYQIAKPSGHRDANGYMSSYYSQPENSITKMKERAAQVIGPLKGMGPTQVDLEFTAKKYGLTIDEVKRRLEQK